MALLVVRPGTGATIQDGGRAGWRRFGVPVGGAADRGSLALANGLLGNPPDAAALELTLLGGSYRAEVDLPLALAGDPLEARVDGAGGSTRAWPIPQAATLRAGETIHLGGSSVGARCYLAVRGGWQVASVLGSRSVEAPVRPGERLMAASGSTPTRRPDSSLVAELCTSLNQACTLRFIAEAGAYLDPLLADEPAGSLGPYRVLDQSNRVGVRFDGELIGIPRDPDRLSEPVVPGTIQVAGGRPIVLGVAGGTIGGYPVLGHVVAADLGLLGQLRPGDRVLFRNVALSEARRLDAESARRRRSALARLAIGVET